LAGDVEFQALGDIPLPLTPNGRGEWSLHDLIVSQSKRFFGRLAGQVKLDPCDAGRWRFEMSVGQTEMAASRASLPQREPPSWAACLDAQFLHKIM
jgi:hypothetical protein